MHLPLGHCTIFSVKAFCQIIVNLKVQKVMLSSIYRNMIFLTILVKSSFFITFCDGFTASCGGGVVGSSDIPPEAATDSSLLLLLGLVCTTATGELVFSIAGECLLQGSNRKI